MIQTFRQIKKRIVAIENTKKVTAAMEMISIAKLNRITLKLSSMRPYFGKLESLFTNLTSRAEFVLSPLFEERQLKERIGLCIITSDSGLCGIYNNMIISAAQDFINSHGRDKINLVCIGKKGFTYFKKRGFKISNAYIGLNGRYSDKVCDEISSVLTESFLLKEVDEAYICHMHSQAGLIHKPIFKKFLNIERQPIDSYEYKYLLEPDADEILRELIPRYLSMKMKMIILEAFLLEHTARAVSMKMATDNARELLEKLIILRNKVRQATITQDMMEIIASTEALKG